MTWIGVYGGEKSQRLRNSGANRARKIGHWQLVRQQKSWLSMKKPPFIMTDDESFEHFKRWLEIKTSWERWKDGMAMPPLSPETRSYFEKLAGKAVRRFVESHPALFTKTAPPVDDRECWWLLMEYLLRKRKVAKRHLLDDIFAYALAKAEAQHGNLSGKAGLELAIGWLLNAFNDRVVKETMRDWCRGMGVRKTSVDTGSLETPVGESGSVLGDFISADDASDDGKWWENEAEKAEVLAVGEAVGRACCRELRPAFKLSLALRGLRQSRGVIISCDDPRVLSVAGVKRTVFADGVNKCLNILRETLAANPAIAELDSAAQRAAMAAAYAALNDCCEDWLFDGGWITDCCGEQKRAIQKKKDTVPPDFCGGFRDHCQALAILVRERLEENEANLSENEMERVFQRLSGPLSCA